MGFVSLVGAGPGDPELLTVKAVDRLKTADLVLYDALVPIEIVELATHAQRFCVGKRSNQKIINQETIQRLMIRGVRLGRRVVRLKCGDPFVLGRGGEEALALKNAGVSFEIIPGLTSAITAPSLAGIPLTHRGLASGFVVVSGHSEAAFKPILSSVTPNSLTLIVLMGMSTREKIASYLINQGWQSTTCTAIVLAASTRNMRTWTGQLQELKTVVIDTTDGAPGTIIIGDVVGLRSLIANVEYLEINDAISNG